MDYYDDNSERKPTYLKKMAYPIIFAGSIASGFIILDKTGSLDAIVNASNNIANSFNSISDLLQIPDFMKYSLQQSYGPFTETIRKTYGGIIIPLITGLYSGAKTAYIARDYITSPISITINSEDTNHLEDFLKPKPRRTKSKRK